MEYRRADNSIDKSSSGSVPRATHTNPQQGGESRTGADKNIYISHAIIN